MLFKVHNRQSQTTICWTFASTGTEAMDILHSRSRFDRHCFSHSPSFMHFITPNSVFPTCAILASPVTVVLFPPHRAAHSHCALHRSRFDSNRFDLMLVDVELPDCRAHHLLPAMRDAVGNTRIAMLSQHRGHDLVAACLRSGADRFYSKPLHLDTLESLCMETLCMASTATTTRVTAGLRNTAQACSAPATPQVRPPPRFIDSHPGSLLHGRRPVTRPSSPPFSGAKGRAEQEVEDPQLLRPLLPERLPPPRPPPPSRLSSPASSIADGIPPQPMGLPAAYTSQHMRKSVSGTGAPHVDDSHCASLHVVWSPSDDCVRGECISSKTQPGDIKDPPSTAASTETEASPPTVDSLRPEAQQAMQRNSRHQRSTHEIKPLAAPVSTHQPEAAESEAEYDRVSACAQQ